MRPIRTALRICALAPLVLSTFRGSAAQPVTMDTGSAVPVRAQALDRTAVVEEIMTAWNDYRIPVNEKNETPYGPFDLRAALKYATPEQLQDAKRAKTFDDVVAALPRVARIGVTPRALAVGQRIPLDLGDVADDLVFTAVTPCRIMDTRFQTVPARIGPDAGVQRNVVSSDYSAQGGVATTCGIPSSPEPAAVSINVTTTNQSSTGSLRIIPTGGGNPPTAVMNYSPIQNIANAMVVGSGIGFSTEIFVYSASAATDVVIDIMGYFTSPAATPLDNTFVESAATACLTGTSCSATATCPAGFVATGGGYRWTSFSLGGGRDVAGSEGSSVMNWYVQATNNTGVTQGLMSFVQCARVPGH